MKYIIIDEKNGETFTEEYSTAADAVRRAAYEWDCLSDHDKQLRTAFYVLESVNPDEDADNHLDGNPVERWK